MNGDNIIVNRRRKFYKKKLNKKKNIEINQTFRTQNCDVFLFFQNIKIRTFEAFCTKFLLQKKKINQKKIKNYLDQNIKNLNLTFNKN